MQNLEFLEQITVPVRSYKSSVNSKNIFTSISDTFYRENFHSDLIAYYLGHELVRKKLIAWLNKILSPDKQIQVADYENGDVRRELGRIDIALYSYDKERCIVIENKSNEAADRDRQLPRYLDYLQRQNIEVESIIYLNKNTLNGPSKEGWSELDLVKINHLLVPTRLVGPNSFLDEVVDNVLKDSNDIRLSGLSLELKILFNELVFGGLNMEDLSGFSQELLKDNNLDKLKKAMTAYNDLPKYWREHYKSATESLKTTGKIPHEVRVAPYKETCLVIDNFRYKGINFGVDLWFSHQRVDISLLTRNGTDKNIEELKEQGVSKWPFGNEKDLGRYRFYVTDPFDNVAVIAAIDQVLVFFRNLI